MKNVVEATTLFVNNVFDTLEINLQVAYKSGYLFVSPLLLPSKNTTDFYRVFTNRPAACFHAARDACF